MDYRGNPDAAESPTPDRPSRRHREAARARLLALLERPGELDASLAALWVAAEEYEYLDVAYAQARIKRLAEGAREVTEGLLNPFARLDRINEFMFDNQGFCPAADDYDDPRNSFLNEVIDRRTGIPLTLSMLYIELVRAAGFEARGVALPGHFVLWADDGKRRVLVDAFGRGRVLTEDDCRDLVRRSTGRETLFRREQLDGVPGRSMLGRLLMNLKHAYLSHSDYRRALAVVERLLLVWPSAHDEIRDRGFLKAHLGERGSAIADLEAYLHLVPTARDGASVRGRLAWLRRREADA